MNTRGIAALLSRLLEKNQSRKRGRKTRRRREKILTPDFSNACKGFATMKTKNSTATVPVFLNQFQIAAQMGAPKSRIFRAVADGKLMPDAFTMNRQPLFAATRLAEIQNMISRPEPVA